MMKKIWHRMAKLRHLGREEAGVTLVVTAFSIVGILGFAGLAVDVGVWYSTARTIQVAADASALAAAHQLAIVGSTNQNVIDAANLVASKNGFTAANGDTVQITIDNVNAEVEVKISRPAPLYFSALFSASQPVVGGLAAAAPRTGSLELALVLDVSGSMSGSSKIGVLITATQDMMDILYGTAETLPDTWVSVLPFSGRVNIRDYGTAWMQNAGSGDAGHLCVGLRNLPSQVNDDAPAVELFPDYVDPGLLRKKPRSNCPDNKALGLTASKTTVKNLLASLTTAFATSTHRGMVWGWRALSPGWQGLWGGDPDLPTPYGGPIQKVVVIMTDGRNTPSLTGDDPPIDTAAADAILLQECTAMKDLGIMIFAVVFDLEGQNNILQLYTDCASPDLIFDAVNGAALLQAFSTIGGVLKEIRLIR